MSRGLQALDLKRPSVGDPWRHGPRASRPAGRRPPRQTFLQHEVVSSAVIRPCSRELLPETTATHSWGWVAAWIAMAWMGTHAHYLPSLTCRRFWGFAGEPAAPGQVIQNALARASYRGHVAYRHNSCRQVPSGRFSKLSAVFPSDLPSSSIPQTRRLHTYLVPRGRASCPVPRASCLSYFTLSCLVALVKPSRVCLTAWTARSGHPVTTAAPLPPCS